MSRRIVKKKSISVSVDLQVNVDESSTNENRRPFRKRRQIVKKQYYCSDSYNSEDDLEEKSRTSEKRKHVHSRGKMMTNSEEHYNKRQDRQLMRPWLVDQVNYGDIPGLVWLDKEQTLIKIPWTHASRHGWDHARDPDLFRRWAKHTGKYSTDPNDKNEDCSPKKWKANFRCAMNSLPDVKEEKSRSQKKGTDAFKVYRLLEEKARGLSRKKSRNSSESSDSDQHYKKYVTKADRLERHKTVTDRVRQKIQNKQMVNMKTGSSNNNHIFNSNTIFNGTQSNSYQPSPQIPVPVSRSYEQQTSSTRYHHQQSYNTCSESDDNSPVKRPDHLQLDRESVALKRPCYTMTQSVESEVEVSTSMVEATIYPRKQGYPHYGQKHEHSYAAPLDNTIPSLVQDFETEPDSDYGSTSPTSSQGTSGENQEEQIAQCISDMESDYLATGLNSSQNSHTMFSPQTPNMNDEPMFCYTPQMHHMDTNNGIYKRSESREFYSVPGTTFDQSFPITNLGAATPMQIENETSIDRNLQFTEF